MTRLRLAVNLVTFLAVNGLLGWWAVANAITFGLTAPATDELTLEFAELPGLREGSEVTYLGHGVGSVQALDLTLDRAVSGDPGAVEVVAGIDPAVDLPAELTATVRRRSALGEPYLELAPAPGREVPGERLAPGDRIPVARTSPPVSYEELLGGVASLLEQVPVEDVDTIVDELATVLDGREDDVVRAIADVDAVLGEVAARAPMLDRLATESTAMAGLVADLAPTVAGSTDDLQSLVTEVRSARGELTELVDRAPALLDTIADLTIAARPELGCLLGTLERSLTELDTPQNADRIEHVLAGAPSLIAMLQDVTHDRDGGPWLRVDAIFNTGTAPVQVYDEPREIPRQQPTTACEPEDYEPPEAVEVDARTPVDALDTGRDEAVDRGSVAADGQAPEDELAAREPSTPGDLDGAAWWPAIAAAAAALLALVGVAAVRRTRGGP